jgi:hypothetical protein
MALRGFRLASRRRKEGGGILKEGSRRASKEC